MSPIDYSGFAFSKGVPRVVAKHAKKVAKDAAERDAYVLVDARDKKTCRASGQPLMAGAVMPQMRLERHHIRPRSLAKDRFDDVSNIVTVSALAHDLIEAHILVMEGTDANKRLVFHWDLKKLNGKQPPFRIASKRKSQRRTA